MTATKMYRREGNNLVLVGANAPNVYNIYSSSEEGEVGTWIDDRTIYRTIVSPTELTEVDNIGDTYHYTYRTDVAINNVFQIISATFFGIDTTNKVRFTAPCYAFMKDDYLYFSSPNTITIQPNKIKLIVEYTKLGLTDKPYSSGSGRFHLQFYGPAEGSEYYNELTIDYHKAISDMPSNIDYELTDVLNGVNNFDFATDEIQGMIAYVESNHSPTENEDLLYSCVGNYFSHSRNSEYNTWRYALSTDFLNSNDNSIDDTDLWNAVDFDNTAISTPGQEVVYKLNYVSPSTYGGSDADAYLDGAVESDPEFYFKIKNINGQYKFYLHRKAMEEDTELQGNLSDGVFSNKIRVKLYYVPGGGSGSAEHYRTIADYEATNIQLHQQNGCELDVLNNVYNFNGFYEEPILAIGVELITVDELDTPVDGNNYQVNYYACINNEITNCSASPYDPPTAIKNDTMNSVVYQNGESYSDVNDHPLWNIVEYEYWNHKLNNVNDSVTFNLNYLKTGNSTTNSLDDYHGGQLVTPQYSLTIKNIGNGQYSFTLNG